MYKTIVSTSYYGLLRVGEVTTGDHPILAENVFVADNRNKVLLVLRTSKTHTTANPPQKVEKEGLDLSPRDRKSRYGPFKLLNHLIHCRDRVGKRKGPLFLFADGTPVKPEQYRLVLKRAIRHCGLDPNVYHTHSMHIGRSCDIFEDNMTVEDIKKLGRWKSNSVYDYSNQC